MPDGPVWLLALPDGLIRAPDARPVPGRLLPWLPGLRFFSHRSDAGVGWRVSEYSTGRACTEICATRAAAVAEARRLLGRFTAARFRVVLAGCDVITPVRRDSWWEPVRGGGA